MATLRITEEDDYRIVQLNRGKVNAINELMVAELREIFSISEQDPKIKGIILTGIPHFLTAGLDLIELYEYDRERIRKFLVDFGAMYVEMSKFSKPFVCGITGHAPAGGTVMAIAADHRIMAKGEKYSLGLNEVAVNILLSSNIIEGFSFWIGKSLASQYILDGKLLGVDEAVKCGFVQEAVPLEEVLSRSKAKMKQYLAVDQDIFRKTKNKLRKSWLNQLDTFQEEELLEIFEIWWKPEVRTKMKAFVDYLTKK